MTEMNVKPDHIRGKTVFVGLSGGVDSAVTAAILQKAGAHVTGVFIKGWYPPGMPCTWAADRRDAMRVAARLRIPFITLDAQREYKQGVIDYLLREYQAGRTPNPDIMCNRDVKFGAFYEFAMRSGADFIATGHYAQHVGGRLLRGSDPDKDQSYFLWAVPKEALARTLFPLGPYTKATVRSMAAALKLPNARKKDSQGICFLGSISVEDFLMSEFGSEPGTAIDAEGNTIGEHTGALLHTMGERIPLRSASPGPWYVIGKDVANNTLTVSRERAQHTNSQTIRLLETNWFNDSYDTPHLEAQYRYHGPRISGTLDAERAAFTPIEPLSEALAPGQSLVVYDGAVCLGGGIIA